MPNPIHWCASGNARVQLRVAVAAERAVHRDQAVAGELASGARCGRRRDGVALHALG